MNFIYLKSSFITWMVYLDPTHWPAHSWLVSSVGRALHRYRRVHGFHSRTGLNFFRVIFSITSSVVFLAARISEFHFFTAVQIYEFHIIWCLFYHAQMKCAPSVCFCLRDIPMPLVSSGVEHGNLRELALARMKDLGTQVRILFQELRPM